jgi:putative PIN family toxin of toxin-antitoxin system
LKVVLDTNIIVSALLSPQGLSAKVLNQVLNGKLTIIYDNNIFAEYVDVLHRSKFKLDKDLVNFIIDFIAKEGEYVIADFQNIQFTDEDDKIFYEVYKSGNVDYLITGNKKHFPEEEGIITVRNFFEKYEQ